MVFLVTSDSDAAMVNLAPVMDPDVVGFLAEESQFFVFIFMTPSRHPFNNLREPSLYAL